MSLLLVKALVSVAMVLALSLIAERASPRVAGILAGYPLGNALSLFFIGYELGPQFAADSALYAQAGFTSALCFTGGYLIGLRLPGRGGIAAALALGLAAFFAASSVLQWVPGTLPVLLGTTVAALLLFNGGYRRLPDAPMQRRRLTWAALAFRTGLAAALVLAITAAAHVLPPSWAGMLAAFPMTMLPFLLIMHVTYGTAMAATVIKHYPGGLGSLMTYALVVSFSYPRIGLAWGTLAGFAAATIYLLALLRLQQARAQRNAPNAAETG